MEAPNERDTMTDFPDISPKDLEDLLTELGLTAESLKRDSVSLREWVNSEPHLPNLTSEHDAWLENFLVVAKNSMEKAKARLDKYFTAREYMADWCIIPPPPMDKIMFNQSKYQMSGMVPIMMPGGCVLSFGKVNTPPNNDWSEFRSDLEFRRFLLFDDHMLALGKKTRGIVYIFDLVNVTMASTTNFLSELGSFRKLMSFLQDALPVRITAIHLVNSASPNLLRLILNALTPILKGKVFQRLFIHDDLASLHKHVSPECLCAEYGGTASWTTEGLDRELNEFILSKKNWYLARSWMKSNEDARLVKRDPSFSVEGSFRKISFD